MTKNKLDDVISIPVNKHPDKVTNDSNNTALMEKKYSQFDQHRDANSETRHSNLSRNKYDVKNKTKNYEEVGFFSDNSQAELESDDYLQSNAIITSNIIEPISSDNEKHFSNEVTNSEETKQVNMIKRKLIKKVTARTVAIEKVKQEDGTKLGTTDASLQNYVKKDQPIIKPVRIHKKLTVNTKSRTTQAIKEKQIVNKITHKQYAETENEICKTKHCDYKNHRSFVKKSRDHDIYKLKCCDEDKTAPNHKNKLNIKKKNTKLKHRHIKSHKIKTTQPEGSSENKVKHDFELRISSNTMSMENDFYVQKHIDDFASVEESVTDDYRQIYIDNSATVEESILKQENLKNSKHFQKERQLDKTLKKVKHARKRKQNSKRHNSEKVKMNQIKYKPTLKEDFISETHTKLCKDDQERKAISGDTLNPHDADTSAIENQDEKETSESSEQPLKQNDFLRKMKLPFYISSTTTARVAKGTLEKHVKKFAAHKNKTKTDMLLDDINTVLKWDNDLIRQNIDLNTTINRLASSKLFKFITDTLASQMLTKLEKSLASKGHLRTKEVNPEKVEQIDIMFKKDGDIVMMGREHVKEEEADETGFREAFYP